MVLFYQEGIILDINAVLNTKFNKKDIYKASLCETHISNGEFSIIYLGEVVGYYSGSYLFDFLSGDFYNTIEINKDAKYKPEGKYVTTLSKLYDKSGKIRPIDVLCDFENSNEEEYVRKR